MTVNVKWEQTYNFWAGRQGHRVAAIVCHKTSASTVASTISWFKSPASDVSAHYVVDKNGDIYQFVKANDTAWHAGEVTNPDTAIPWLAEAVARGINPNYLTIGIEHVGMSVEGLTTIQYASSLRLIKYLSTAYAIPRDPTRIIGHNRINAVNRPNCPGVYFPWRQLFADLG